MHCKHFVLLHSEVVAVSRPTKGSVALLAVDVFFGALQVVRRGKVGIGVVVAVAVVVYTQVSSSSEYWPVAAMAADEFVIVDGRHFLLAVELQQGPSPTGCLSAFTLFYHNKRTRAAFIPEPKSESAGGGSRTRTTPEMPTDQSCSHSCHYSPGSTCTW